MMRSVSAAFTLTILGTAAFGQASFQGLGIQSGMRAMSSDGGVAVGWSRGRDALIWTRGVGLEYIAPPTGFTTLVFTAVSGDGQTLVGQAGGGLGSAPFQAVRWSRTDGFELLAELPDSQNRIRNGAEAISRDGSTIFGTGRAESSAYAVRWRGGAQPQVLGGTPEQPRPVFAGAANADGSMAAVSTFSQAFRWSDAGLEAVTPASTAYGITWEMSDDGSVISGGPNAWRWSETDGFLALPALPDGRMPASARSMSADGAVLAGTITNTTIPGRPDTAWYWTAANGTQYVTDVLTGYGIDLMGWTVTSVDGMSADGRTLIGTGLNPLGGTESWYATIPGPLPAPGAVVVFGLAGVVVMRRRR